MPGGPDKKIKVTGGGERQGSTDHFFRMINDTLVLVTKINLLRLQVH